MICCNTFLRIYLNIIYRHSLNEAWRKSWPTHLGIYIYYVMSRLIPSESEPVYLICELNGNYNY